MLPPVKHHVFVTRLVKTNDGLQFYRLTQDADGVLYFISKHPMSCRLDKIENFEKLINELQGAYELPIIDHNEIK